MLEINALDPLPFTPPEPIKAEEMEVVDEENVTSEKTSESPTTNTSEDSNNNSNPPETEGEGQTTLF